MCFGNLKQGLSVDWGVLGLFDPGSRRSSVVTGDLCFVRRTAGAGAKSKELSPSSKQVGRAAGGPS